MINTRRISLRRIFFFGSVLVFSSLMFPLGAVSQSLYLYTIANPIHVLDGDDSAFQMVFTVGYYKDSAWHPDGKTHTYAITSALDTNFTLASPSPGSFTGYDTLLIRFRPHKPYRSDGEYSTIVQLSTDGLPPIPFKLTGTSNGKAGFSLHRPYSTPQLQVGAHDCFDVVDLVNNNDIPITLTSLDFSTKDSVRFSNPPQLPLIIGAHATNYFIVCAHAPSVPDTLRGFFTATIKSGNLFHDTSSFDASIIVVPVSLDDCLGTSWSAGFPTLYDWNLSANGTVYFWNQLNVPLTVTGAKIELEDSQYFTLENRTWPLTLAPHAHDSLRVSVSLPHDSSRQNYWSVVRFDVAGNDSNGIPCPSNAASLDVRVMRNFDTAFASVSGVVSSPIEFVSWDGYRVGKLVKVSNSWVRNAQLSNVSITGRDSNLFQLSYLSSNADSLLRPGDYFVAYIEFPLGANTPYGHYFASLRLISASLLDTVFIPLEGEVVSLSVGPLHVTPALLTVSPNPASGFVRILLSHVLKCNVSIVDALGKTVARERDVQTVAPSFNVPGTGSLEPGGYIVRVDGVDEDGQHFVISRRVVIIR